MAAIGELVGHFAHEVRAPLFAMTATLDVLDLHCAGRECPDRRHLLTLRAQVDRLSALVHDLLDFGRPVQDPLPWGTISDVVEDVLASVREHAAAAGVTVSVRCAAPLPPVRLDARRLGQAFRNLVDNAIQHARAGGGVRFSVSETTADGRRFLECQVADDGAGFRSEDLPRVFDAFFSRRRGGTGLGLAIVRRVVEEHGGRVSASNDPGGGGLVVVLLPVPEP